MSGGNEREFSRNKKVEDHQKNVKAKTARLERRSGTGRSLNETPKKKGCGSKFVWGSFQDDIDDYWTT